MRIVYMGTPDFAVPALEILAYSDHEIVLVVTKPDKPAKRGNKITASPVKKKADELGLAISQPEKIRGNTKFFELMTGTAPDLIVVCAYGNILPLDILNIPSFGSINIHASLLPKYRGAAPIQRAIMAGDEVTGVTLMYMAEGIDEGDIFASSKIDIDSKNAGELHDELAVAGAELLKDELESIEKNETERFAQDHEKATYAPIIEKEDGHLDLTQDAEIIERLVRAMTPFPGAFAFIDGKKMKVIKAHTGSSGEKEVPGTILKAEQNGIVVKAGGDSTLIITKLQMPGKKAMDTADFLRGNKLTTGRRLK